MTEAKKEDLEKYISNDHHFVELFKKLSTETQIKDQKAAQLKKET